MNLTDLISCELDYFRPMIEQDKQSSFEQRESYGERRQFDKDKRGSLLNFTICLMVQ